MKLNKEGKRIAKPSIALKSGLTNGNGLTNGSGLTNGNGANKTKMMEKLVASKRTQNFLLLVGGTGIILAIVGALFEVYTESPEGIVIMCFGTGFAALAGIMMTMVAKEEASVLSFELGQETIKALADHEERMAYFHNSIAKAIVDTVQRKED
ncbi:MAG: hypothetical protein KAU14_09760 [Thermoplasmata archaeon]|nr:hypothetical protein [Thermoplasmata archaeon]